MNLAAMMNDAMRDASLLDGSVIVSILQPLLGGYSNYTDTAQTTIMVSWQLTTFNSTHLSTNEPYAYNVTTAVDVHVDGVLVGTFNPGETSAVINVKSLDSRFPHRVTVTSTTGVSRYPLSFDWLDENVPLAHRDMVPASAAAIIWLA